MFGPWYELLLGEGVKKRSILAPLPHCHTSLALQPLVDGREASVVIADSSCFPK